MTASDQGSRPVVYLVGCAAPPTREIERLVHLVQGQQWDACAILTPQAVRFADVPKLEKLTGYPVRSEYKEPGSPDALPPADAMIVAPATCNTINKWAAGISDTLALGLVTEAIGKRLPLVALPFTNSAQAAHPAFERSIDDLRSWGVAVLYGPEVYKLHPPGTGSKHLDLFPWHLTLEPVRNALRSLPPEPAQARE